MTRSRRERRHRFLDSYVDELIDRDVRQLSDIERPAQMRALLRLLAGRSGQLLVANALSNELQLSASSVHRYLALAEEVFLVKRIPAWSRRVTPRAVRAPNCASSTPGSRRTCSTPTRGPCCVPGARSVRSSRRS